MQLLEFILLLNHLNGQTSWASLHLHSLIRILDAIGISIISTGIEMLKITLTKQEVIEHTSIK